MTVVDLNHRWLRMLGLVTAFALAFVNLLSATGSKKGRAGTWTSAERKNVTVFESPPRTRHYHPSPMLEGRRLWEEHQRRRTSWESSSLSSLFQTNPEAIVQTSTRIVNGKPVPARDNYAFSAGSKLCGGTLIHEDIVLTAARTFLVLIPDAAR